ncbi:hypothetical protein X742_24330 [Mesorhizobium sp. LNHC232B00]|nr:hypothetical protein X742_24330 [Mesorhizobium sp. LNHC232B00]
MAGKPAGGFVKRPNEDCGGSMVFGHRSPQSAK